MEAVWHDIQELQKIADDLAVGGILDVARYEADSEMFLGRIDGYVLENCSENFDYLNTKLAEVRAHMGYLLRMNHANADPERYQALVVQGLNNVYRSIRNPTVVEAEGEDYE